MTIQKTNSGERSPQLTPIILIAFCLAAGPASSGEPDPPGQFVMQWLAKLSPHTEKPSAASATFDSHIADSPYIQAGDALPEELLRVICRDRRWRDFAASQGGEWHYNNLCMQRLKPQTK